MTRELLEQALDALVEVYYHDSHWPPKQKAAIEALRAELAKPEAQQECKPMNSDQRFLAWTTARAASHISFVAGIEAAEAFHGIKETP